MTEASNAPADRSEIEIKSVSVGVSASQSIALARSSTDSLTSWARKVRHMRFLLIRALSCPVPGLSSKTVPLIGGRTGLEIIVCIIIAAAVVAFSLVGDAGSVLAASIFVAVILGLRTNVLEIVFGVSFERALYYHKWFGSLVLAIMVIHILQRGVSTSGIVLIITTVLIGTVYLGKNLNFEFFYYGHIAAYIATAITLLFHGGKLGTFSLIAYAADLVLRYLIRGRKVSAEVEKLPGDVVRLTFPRDFEHEAGGYVFVRIPELSHIEYHPFSISSSALEPNVTIHIRALGDWSSRLLDHAAKHQEEALKAGAGAKLSKTMDLYLEGPYGSASIDLADDAYEVFLLISGGIGVTPMQGIYNTLLLECEAGRKLRKVIFIWSVRDKVMMTIDKTRIRKPPETDEIGLISGLPPSFQPMQIKSSAKLNPNKIIPGKSGNPVDQDSPTANTSHDIMSPSIFHAEFYLTQVKSKEALLEAGMAEDQPDRQLRIGRPDIPKLFDSVRELCRSSGIRRVAVGVCGPVSMVDEVDDLCRQSKLASDSAAVRFDCHKEVFDF